MPWFGGSAAVWTTCLVFFQLVLLCLSLALLPLIPEASWKPDGAGNPVWRILGLRSVTIGLPYFLLSTTNPLLQAWFLRAYPQRSPYRLFALSNLASMLALFGYPLAIEPWASTSAQARTWSLVYVAFVVLCAAAGWHSLRRPPAMQPDALRLAGEAATPLPTPGEQLLWVALAAMGAVLLLAVTNHLSQDIAAIPLLWVLLLGIYLLTFILCFDGRRWYRRDLFLCLLAPALCVMASLWLVDPNSYFFQFGLLFQIALFCAGLFIACMFCHGELSRLRPAPRHLTRFYLLIALGGAAGSLLVGIVAPLVLPGYFELLLGLAALAAP